MTLRITCFAMFALLTVTLVPPLGARELFVAPTGTAQGDGSRERPFDWASALAVAGAAKPGDTVWLLPGVYERLREEKEYSSSGRPYVIGVSGTIEQPLRVQAAADGAAVIDAWLQIAGSHVQVVGIEVGLLDWAPSQRVLRPQPSVVVLASRGVTLINCNLFGGAGGGVSAGKDAQDFTMDGCLVHDFGQVGRTQAFMDIGTIAVAGGISGAGLSCENMDGVKTFRQCLIYRGGGHNISLTRDTQGFDFIETVSFLSVGHKNNESSDSFGITGGYGNNVEPRLDRIRVLDCVAYQPSLASPWRPNMRLWSYAGGAPLSGTAEIRGCLIMGAHDALHLTRWASLTLVDNQLWSVSNSVVMPADMAANAGAHRVDGNVYTANGVAKPFKLGEDALGFAEWQALGFDRNGRLEPGRDGQPSGTMIRVFRNAHEKGRGHVAVFNWDEQRQVGVDLAPILDKGMAYRVYNVQDISTTIAAATPVFAGIYAGGPVMLPAKRSPDCPHFEAFLVLPHD